MPSRPLPRSSPSAHRIDAGGILHFIDALERTDGVEPHSVMLVRHGEIVAEGWWAPFAAERPHLLYSLSKSFTAAAVGLAIDEGLMSLDATVLSYFPELDEEVTDARSRAMLVRHVAAMASGHSADTIDRATATDPVDLLRGFLLVPPDEEPGTVFAYNQPCTFALAAIVRRVSGVSLLDFLRTRLLDPLGIGEVGWLRDPRGDELGFSGLHATTEAIAKLGQLHLRGGRWNGVQLLPADWVAEATRTHIANPEEANPDWKQGYGFQFWMARHGYRGDGAFGQFCVVLPEHDVVLAMTGQTDDMQAVLDAAWDHLLPAIDQTSSATADDALLSRTRNLELPAVERPFADLTATFTPSAAHRLSELSAVSVLGGTVVTLVDSGEVTEFSLGRGEWAVTDAIAASGGFGGAPSSDITIDVLFLETPHRLRITCHPEDETFEAVWVTEPLHALPLTEMRMPRVS